MWQHTDNLVVTQGFKNPMKFNSYHSVVRDLVDDIEKAFASNFDDFAKERVDEFFRNASEGMDDILNLPLKYGRYKIDVTFRIRRSLSKVTMTPPYGPQEESIFQPYALTTAIHSNNFNEVSPADMKTKAEALLEVANKMIAIQEKNSEPSVIV